MGAVAVKPASLSSTVRPIAYRNPESVAERSSGEITVTFTNPGAFAGAIALISVELTNVTCADVLDPKTTREPALKYFPTIVIGTPPVNGLFLGLTAEMTGDVIAVPSVRSIRTASAMEENMETADNRTWRVLEFTLKTPR